MTTELTPLSNQATIIHAYSRFNKHPIFVDPITGNKFIGTWNPPPIPEKESDITFLITNTHAFRPDLISYEFYETPLLAWVISYVNDISNPLDRKNGLYPGRVIRIPDLTTITAALTF